MSDSISINWRGIGGEEDPSTLSEIAKIIKKVWSSQLPGDNGVTSEM